MKATTTILCLFLASATFAACGSDEPAAGDGLDPTGVDGDPGPGAFSADYASSSEFFTLMSGLHAGQSPHGKVQIWYSRNIKEALEGGGITGEVPLGTVAIKEFDSDGNDGIDGIALMIKKDSGYDPDHGDWYYAMLDTAGNVMDAPAPGANSACISCHAAAAANDYLAGTHLR